MFIPDDEPEESDTAAEPEPVNKSSKVPVSGTEFEYNGIKFVALGEEQGGLLAVVAELLEDELPFDKDMLDQALTTLGYPPIGGEEGKRRIQTLNVVNAEKADEYQLGEGDKKLEQTEEPDDSDAETEEQDEIKNENEEE